MDAWCDRHRGTPYDANGAFAASGTIDAALLARLRNDPWFALRRRRRAAAANTSTSTGRSHA
jgi:1,6-anhydro-N-acetylmuramate kinase